MNKKLWIVAAALALVLGGAGYTIAQSAASQPRGDAGWMMGSGMGMTGGGMMGQGGMMGGGMMNMMMGRPLTEEQLEQFAKQHGITIEQAKQMTDQCSQVMGRTPTSQTPTQ